MPEVHLAEFLSLTLVRDGTTPLARQLYEALRELILAGDLAAGAKLPATRTLAGETRLSRNTVLSAYAQLQCEGYVLCTTGSGTFVSDTVPALLEAGAPRADTQGMQGGAGEPTILSARGGDIVGNAQASSQQWGAFVPGVPDVSLFPHAIWARLYRRQWRSPAPELLTYAHGAGHPPLRRVLAHHLRLSRSVRCEPRQVVITGGVHQSISLAAWLLGDSGQAAWVENPSYWGATTMLKACGIRTVPVDVDEQGLAPTPAQMREPPQFIFVSPSHQYPLGTVMSLARRRMLLEYAHQHRIWIIEDDYDSEFRFDGRPVPSLQGLDSHDRVIYLGTFSKTLYPGLRLGYMVLPPQLEAHFANGLSELYREGRLLDQAVLADFLKEGHYATHIRRMRTLYNRRQSLLREVIFGFLGPQWPVSTHEAGLHLVLHLPDGVDDVGIMHAARAGGISVKALSRYYAGGSGKRGLLLGYAGVPETQIRPGFGMLMRYMEPALSEAGRQHGMRTEMGATSDHGKLAG